MFRLFFYGMGMALIFTHQASAANLGIDEILHLARQNSPEPKQDRYRLDEARAGQESIDQVIDWTVFGNASGVDDQTEDSSALGGDSRRYREYKIGLRKAMHTGTSFELSAVRSKTLVNMPASSTAGTGLPSFSFGPTYNPDYTTGVTLAVRQDLWRNFFGREVKLQKAAMGSAVVLATFDRAVKLQLVQGEAETLTWELIALNERVRLSRSLLRSSREFSTGMEKRLRLGRANDVDVAAARSLVIENESAVLALEIARDKLARRLAARIWGTQAGQRVPAVAGSVPATNPWKPPASRAEAMTRALADRLELRALREQRVPLQAAFDLAAEKDKPSVALFGSLGGLGRGETESASADGWSNRRKTMIGLQFEMNLSGTESRTGQARARAQLQMLDARRDIFVMEIRREIDDIYTSLNGADRQLTQYRRHLRTLQDQVAAEKRRVRQARSDRVATLRYEMELNAARMERIEALRSRRIAETRLRLALHAYPGVPAALATGEEQP